MQLSKDVKYVFGGFQILVRIDGLTAQKPWHSVTRQMYYAKAIDPL